MKNGYYRYPTIGLNNTIVFTADDDLWEVPLIGGMARRLTSGLGSCTYPHYSADGKWLAFSSSEEGTREIYVVASEGGAFRRLTYLGANSIVLGWMDHGEILFRTDGLGAQRTSEIATVSIHGGAPVALNLGPATRLALADDGRALVERNSNRPEPAHWKRYRGGTAGQFFFAESLDCEFRQILRELKGNLSNPFWLGSRLYFISDHEGIANIHSCGQDGTDVRTHTGFKEFYVRNATCNGAAIVFHAGGDLYAMDPKTDKVELIPVEFISQHVQRQRKWVEAGKNLESFALSPDGSNLLITTRGQVATMAPWGGPVRFIGREPGVRFRLGRSTHLPGKTVMVTDSGGEEKLALYDRDLDQARVFPEIEFGRASELRASPTELKVCLFNHRNELILADLEEESAKVISHNRFNASGDFSWSPDGRYIAFSLGHRPNCNSIQVYELETQKIYPVSDPLFHDYAPAWDPEGRYLYFLSNRDLNPVYDSIQFELSFPQTAILCVAVLQKDTPHPFLGPRSSTPEPDQDTPAGDEAKPARHCSVQIDFEGLSKRLVRAPVPTALYRQVAALKDKVLLMSWPVEGALDVDWRNPDPPSKGTLHALDLQTLKSEVVASGINGFVISEDRRKVAVQSHFEIRVWNAGQKAPEAERVDADPAARFSEKAGRVDLSRCKVLVDPPTEWAQMFREVWRLQRDHYWREDMNQIDWQRAYDRYSPLLGRIDTRSELADLIWEMQGELGTSHAYDIGGDYRKEPVHRVGALGARFEWNDKEDGYEIVEIYRGDWWAAKQHSPLAGAGASLSAGDILVSLDGVKLDAKLSPRQALYALADQEVEVGWRKPEQPEIARCTVKTLSSETPIRYRQWVESNRKLVHEKSGGRLGYVHIPDMAAHGFSEFHRSYLQEYDADGLVVDVRYNGGGHVSSLILEKLARRRIGLDETRWFGTVPYPGESPAGPIVALTNEFAGSDGDIFSHSFKLMKIGPLLGKRTWGGVVGIWPRHSLVDGGLTTQPEFSFWFSDVGFDVENYGTDPDIEVENFPHHYRGKFDNQLERAITEALGLLETQKPFRPVVDRYPDLSV